MPTVTYSPEDNKIRLYVGRVPRDEYEMLRAAGFVSTPKQNCDFAATWTPHREDLAKEYLEDDEDIGDEDYSPAERAADRAERFGGYRDKRATEAGAAADVFESGPQAFGSQSIARAERQARRHDRHRVYAVSQWSKAEYWQQRTAGVISNALYKSSPHVRRGRILTLEAEQRKHESSREAHATEFARWQKVLTLPGADQPVVRVDTPTQLGIDKDATSPAARFAYALASYSHGWHHKHPRTEKESSLCSLMNDPADPITAAEAAGLWLGGRVEPFAADSYSARWSAHLSLRLEYERTMLANEGGMVGESDIEPGGWIRGARTRSALTDVSGGWLQVQKVNRSPATKRVTSVEVMGTSSGFTASSGYRIHATVPALVNVNIERLGEDCYRPPTEEERAAFAESLKARKAKKAAGPKPPPTINPTDEDAQRLQDLWNAQGEADHIRRKRYGTFKPSEILRTTQAHYSEASKGTYGTCSIVTISENLRKLDTRFSCDRVSVFKVRRTSAGSDFCGVDRVIILTDKPQNSIPWESVEEAKAKQPTRDDVAPRIQELAVAIAKHRDHTPEEIQLINDAKYVGLARDSYVDSPGLSRAGEELFRQYCEALTPNAYKKSELVEA